MRQYRAAHGHTDIIRAVCGPPPDRPRATTHLQSSTQRRVERAQPPSHATSTGDRPLTGARRHQTGLPAAVLTAANFILRYCKNGQVKLGHPKHWHYGLYYCAQGMFQIGGAYWETFAETMYKYLLPRQKADGSFGSPYQTAMTVLALRVTSRQLPIYQR